ncbi:hypothetical protein G9A89_018048 [Geosiphon pyriformis]|nr:hypothetical protein G9A89_018048 [Geosiphon pyriformis]
MDMAIELVQRIENNQKMHLRFTLPVFAPALVMASAFQMASQQPFYQRQQNHGLSVCYHCGLTRHFSRDCNNLLLSPLALRNNDN